MGFHEVVLTDDKSVVVMDQPTAVWRVAHLVESLACLLVVLLVDPQVGTLAVLSVAWSVAW
jgi:hypothetical protein